MIEVWFVIHLMAFSMAAISLLSLAFWLVGLATILNPFAALLMLVASGFFYWMSAISKRDHKLVYTFICEWKTGTYLHQVIAKDLNGALHEWYAKIGGVIDTEEAFQPGDDEPVKVDQLSGVWCFTGMYEDELVLVHVVCPYDQTTKARRSDQGEAPSR